MSDHGPLHGDPAAASGCGATSCQINTSCFEDDATRRLIEFVTKQILLTASLAGIDLSSLDGVTFTHDCEETAATLQYLPEGAVPLERTRTPEVLEMGQTVAVKRENDVRFHIVLRAGLGVMALSSDRDDQELVHLCFAHEAAHVEHEANVQAKFPELRVSLPAELSDRSRLTFLKAVDVWSEYAACRSSAFFRPSSVDSFENAFCAALTTVAGDCRRRIAEFRRNGDAVSAFRDIQQIAGDLFIDAGYFFGHLDGIERTLETAPRAAELLSKERSVSQLISKLWKSLREMWMFEYGWNSLEVFTPIYDVIRDLMSLNGLVFARSGTEWRIVMCEEENAGLELRQTLDSWAGPEN